MNAATASTPGAALPGAPPAEAGPTPRTKPSVTFADIEAIRRHARRELRTRASVVLASAYRPRNGELPC